MSRVSRTLVSWLLPITAACAGGSTAARDTAIVPADAQIEHLWGEGAFTEGAAVGPDGNIYFVDYPFDQTPGRVLKFSLETGETTVHCADSGKANGLMFDRQGRLIACCGSGYGKMALCEVLSDGKVRVLIDRYRGKRLNSPNDLVIDPQGRIYFSDPRYLGPEPMELDHMSVYRLDPNGTLVRFENRLNQTDGHRDFSGWTNDVHRRKRQWQHDDRSYSARHRSSHDPERVSCASRWFAGGPSFVD